MRFRFQKARGRCWDLGSSSWHRTIGQYYTQTWLPSLSEHVFNVQDLGDVKHSPFQLRNNRMVRIRRHCSETLIHEPQIGNLPSRDYFLENTVHCVEDSSYSSHGCLFILWVLVLEVICSASAALSTCVTKFRSPPCAVTVSCPFPWKSPQSAVLKLFAYFSSLLPINSTHHRQQVSFFHLSQCLVQNKYLRLKRISLAPQELEKNRVEPDTHSPQLAGTSQSFASGSPFIDKKLRRRTMKTLQRREVEKVSWGSPGLQGRRGRRPCCCRMFRLTSFPHLQNRDPNPCS